MSGLSVLRSRSHDGDTVTIRANKSSALKDSRSPQFPPQFVLLAPITEFATN
jgi:hypothetical protein